MLATMLEIQQQFNSAEPLKMCSDLKYFDPTEGGNTLEDAADILLAITPNILKKGTFLQEKNIQVVLKIKSNDYQNLETEEGNALVYVGGYFLRKCLLKHSCDIT